MTEEGAAEWAHHGWARQTQHKTVKTLAPADESALTITCGKRVLARVWPRGPAERLFMSLRTARPRC